MTSPPTSHTALAQHRITRLAAQLPVHRAFHWLHLHQPQLLRWQLEFLAIPAPPFAEQARAAWFLERFTELGLTYVHLDDEGNALAELPGSQLDAPFLLVSAHLDTVFPAGTDTVPTEDGTRILGPGACDNGAGLTGLLALIAALRHAGITPPNPILFCANVGEEGEGDLRGMRQLFERGPYRGRIAAALPLEGSGTGSSATRGLGSRRFRATISGPGGHSWSDSTIPNPITLVARAIAILADLPSLATDKTAEPRTTFSPGIITGGTSINSIPESAAVLLDLRSTDAAQLDLHAAEIARVFTTVVTAANSPEAPITLTLDLIGNRPAAALPDDAPLIHTLRAVDRHLGIRTELRLGSTDANIPLAHGIPAAALAAGGTGGGIHTLSEWYDPTGRELALRRILLILLDLAQST
jgi:acetylornithine deacetylase/succinyl-diaminopimelate desuccinylase-like protein